LSKTARRKDEKNIRTRKGDGKAKDNSRVGIKLHLKTCQMTLRGNEKKFKSKSDAFSLGAVHIKTSKQNRGERGVRRKVSNIYPASVNTETPHEVLQHADTD